MAGERGEALARGLLVRNERRVQEAAQAAPVAEVWVAGVAGDNVTIRRGPTATEELEPIRYASTPGIGAGDRGILVPLQGGGQIFMRTGIADSTITDAIQTDVINLENEVTAINTEVVNVENQVLTKAEQAALDTVNSTLTNSLATKAAQTALNTTNQSVVALENEVTTNAQKTRNARYDPDALVNDFTAGSQNNIGHSFTVEANRKYQFDAVLFVTPIGSFSGARFGITVPSGTSFIGSVKGRSAADPAYTTQWFSSGVNSAYYIQSASGTQAIEISASIVVGGTAGTVQQCAQLAVNLQTLAVENTSWARITDVT